MINYLKFFHSQFSRIVWKIKAQLGIYRYRLYSKTTFTLIHWDCTSKTGNNASIKHADFFIPLYERNIICRWIIVQYKKLFYYKTERSRDSVINKSTTFRFILFFFFSLTYIIILPFFWRICQVLGLKRTCGNRLYKSTKYHLAYFSTLQIFPSVVPDHGPFRIYHAVFQ